MGRVNSHIASGGGFPVSDYAYINAYATRVSYAFYYDGTAISPLPSEFTLDISQATIKQMDDCLYSLRDNLGSMVTLNLIGSTGSAVTLDLFLGRQNALVTINGEFDFSSINTDTQRPFFNCSSLQEVRFKAGTLSRSMTLAQSPNLSADSLASIVNGLADLSGGTSKTLTLHATAKANLTAEQLATISSKNWALG